MEDKNGLHNTLDIFMVLLDLIRLFVSSSTQLVLMFPAARKHRGKTPMMPLFIIEVRRYGRTFRFGILQNSGSTVVLESLKGGAFSLKTL